jgi:uncharacterized membrane protein YgcG
VTRAAGRDGGDLAGWLVEQGLAPADSAGGIADAERVRALLLDAAREGRALSYSELLGLLGHRFTRPKMRAVCRTLDAIDAAGEPRGEPGLAVLVVRESDHLPGQGWWIGAAERWGYAGLWTGPDAAAFVRAKQQEVFRFWREQASAPLVGLPERRRIMAQKGAGGNPGAVTDKGGDPGSGAKSKTTGGKGGGGRSGGSKSGSGGSSGGGSSGGSK